MKQKTVLQAIIAFIFGHKYYVNVFNRRGTPICEISSFIFSTDQEARRHRRELDGSITFQYIETVTFRSRNLYKMGSFSGVDATLLTEE